MAGGMVRLALLLPLTQWLTVGPFYNGFALVTYFDYKKNYL